MANKEKSLEELKKELEQAQEAYDLKQKEIALKEAEAAERKRAELEAEKNKRKEEIEKAKRHYLDLIQQYIKDYGRYEFDCSYNEDEDFLSFLFGNKPFRFFI